MRTRICYRRAACEHMRVERAKMNRMGACDKLFLLALSMKSTSLGNMDNARCHNRVATIHRRNHHILGLLGERRSGDAPEPQGASRSKAYRELLLHEHDADAELESRRE